MYASGHVYATTCPAVEATMLFLISMLFLIFTFFVQLTGILYESMQSRTMYACRAHFSDVIFSFSDNLIKFLYCDQVV